MTHLMCAFGYQILCVQTLWHTLLLFNFHCPCHKLLYMHPFVGFPLHMCDELEHREITLLCKVLSVYLLLLQHALRSACIPFGVFLGHLPLCFCCNSLGIQQYVIELVECWLLDNLKAIIWCLKFGFFILLTTLMFLNSMLKGCINGVGCIIFIFKRKGCCQQESHAVQLAELTLPLCLHTPSLFCIFNSSFQNIILVRHYSDFEGLINQFESSRQCSSLQLCIQTRSHDLSKFQTLKTQNCTIECPNN